MKFKLISAFSILLLASSCSTTEMAISTKEKQANQGLVQLSYFTIATVDRDTLYIQGEDEIGSLLYKMWENGTYSDTQPACKVIKLNQTEFQKLVENVLAKN